ncbi:MAG: DUF6569 family protein [Solirubrobacterales bacterium]
MTHTTDADPNAEAATQTDSIANLLAEPLRVGEPVRIENLTVFPLFGPGPRLDYVSFAQGREDGVRVGEIEGRASVNDLVVENRSGEIVLLYEGEEVLGAQQNRTFDVSALVAPGAKVRMPVSCMEAGRWDGRRNREEMLPAPQTANPRIRRAKALQVNAVLAAGPARAMQADVWDEVAHERARHAAHSPTGAMNDVYEHRRDRLRRIEAAAPCQEGQVGSIAAINGSMRVLDYASRPDVYRSLHGRLVQGYGLDALAEEQDGRPADASLETARGFALLAGEAPISSRRPGCGLGEEVRFAAHAATGSGLANRGELIQLSVFPDQGDGDSGSSRRPGPRPGRVRRPSRRRRL